MDKVAQPLPRLSVWLARVRRHVQRPLSQKGLRIWRHVRQVVHDYKHLDDSAQRVEQSELDGSLVGYSVPFFTKVNMSLKNIIILKEIFN